MRLAEKFRNSGWAQGSGGGLLGSICCIFYAVAVAAGSGGGATLFGSWMAKYRLEFFLVGVLFMLGTFIWTIRKHGFHNKKAMVSHVAVMLVTFLVVSELVALTASLSKS